MKTLWYYVSRTCSDKWTDEASQEYINRPFHLIRESDGHCMSCHKSVEDYRKWVKEYQQQLGKGWQVIEKANPHQLDILNKAFGKIFAN